MKRMATLVLVLILILGTTCSALAGTLDEILERGTLRAGVSLGGLPMGSRDDAGNPIGFDYEYAVKMAEELGVELELIEVDGDTRIPSLTSDRVDIIFANITGTLQRALVIDFSIPYIITGIKMIAKTESTWETMDDINTSDCTVAVCRGTTAEDLVKENAPEAKMMYVTNFNDIVLAVRQGKADVGFEDGTGIDYAAMTSNGVLEARGQLYTSDPICLGIAKGDSDFLNWVNMFVSSTITSGWNSEQYVKFFGIEPVAELTTIW